jgi:hypothetical protein
MYKFWQSSESSCWCTDEGNQKPMANISWAIPIRIGSMVTAWHTPSWNLGHHAVSKGFFLLANGQRCHGASTFLYGISKFTAMWSWTRGNRRPQRQPPLTLSNILSPNITKSASSVPPPGDLLMSGCHPWSRWPNRYLFSLALFQRASLGGGVVASRH